MPEHCTCRPCHPDSVTGRCYRCHLRYRPAELPYEVWRGEPSGPVAHDPTQGDAVEDPLDPMGLGPPDISGPVFIPTNFARPVDAITAYRALCQMITNEWGQLSVDRREWYLDHLTAAYRAMSPDERSRVDPPAPPAL